MIDLERRRKAALKVKQLIGVSLNESDSGSLLGAAQKANIAVLQLFDDLSKDKIQRVTISVRESHANEEETSKPNQPGG